MAEVFLAAVDNLREILVGLVLGVIAGSGGSPLLGLVLGLAGVGVALTVGYQRWRHTRYWVRTGALHLRQGVFTPDETSIPLGRIQAIDSAQGPIQRLFGVQALHVQTAGGGSEGEIVLRAVDAAEASRLRSVVGLPDPGPETGPAWRLSGGSLLVAALTAPQLGVILPVLGAAAAAGQDLFSASEGEHLLDRAPHSAGALALIAAALAGAALVVSVIGAVVAFAGFAVTQDDGRLRIRRGLLQRRTASLPLARVHAVDVVEGVLRRPFGLASVRIETAGYRKEGTAAQTLLPLVRMADVPRLLTTLTPALGSGLDVPLQRPPARARRRYALPPAIVGAVLGAGVTVALAGASPAAWAAIPALALAGAAEGRLSYPAAGWSDDGRHLVIRRRVIARRTLVARVDRLQEHSTTASLLQRRADLADFHAAVGSGRTGRVDHLEAADAQRLFERLRPASP
jgi:putative membrane protein